MHIPGKILIGAIKEGNVYLFQNPNFTNVDHEHFHVVVNRSPQVEEVIILVHATSQVEKKRQWVESNNLPDDTLVITNPTECQFLSKETAFNCNDRTLFTKDDLESLTDSYQLKYIEQIPTQLLERIRAGLMASPLIEEEIKDLFR